MTFSCACMVSTILTLHPLVPLPFLVVPFLALSSPSSYFNIFYMFMA